MAEKKPIRRLLMKRRRGSVFPNEIAGYSDPLASRLIANKDAIEVDEDGRPLSSALETELAGQVPTGGATSPSGSAADSTFKFDLATDPFVTDGITEKASRALHEKGLHTVEDVKAFLTAGGQLGEIPGLHATQEDKILKLYGADAS